MSRIVAQSTLTLARESTIIARMRKHEFEKHLYEMSGGMSRNAAAQALGMNTSTLARQLDGAIPLKTVVAACRLFGAPFLPAFVAAGFITKEEADAIQSNDLSQIDGKIIADEVTKRLVR